MAVDINMTTDHDEIRRWVESVGGRPVQVRIEAAGNAVELPRLDFEGQPTDQGARAISWDAWFAMFDDAGLALLYEQAEADGSRSTFNKLVPRDQR